MNKDKKNITIVVLVAALILTFGFIGLGVVIEGARQEGVRLGINNMIVTMVNQIQNTGSSGITYTMTDGNVINFICTMPT